MSITETIISPYQSKEAYVTLLVNDNFSIGVEVLLYTLLKYRDNQDNRDIILLITPNVSKLIQKKLLSLYPQLQILIVNSIANPQAIPKTTSNNNESDSNTTTTVHVQGWIDSGYTKLHIWSLINYTRILYLDADMLITQSGISNIWNYPSPLPYDIHSSISSSSSSTSTSSSSVLTPFFVTPPCAVPDVFPPDKFNAGLLLIEPNMDTFNDMLNKLITLPSYDGGDTGFLNAYFSVWFTSTIAEHILANLSSTSPYRSSPRLPFGYNAQRILHWFTNPKAPGYWKSIQPLIIIHYSSTPKPWENTND